MRDNTCAVAILDRLVGTDIALREGIQEQRFRNRISQAVYQLLEDTGLTQEQFAKKVGMEPSVIELLEDADFDGDSAAMLHSIEAVLEVKSVVDCGLAGAHR